MACRTDLYTGPFPVSSTPTSQAPATGTEPVIGICAVHERARWAFWDQTAHLVADTYVAALQSTGAIAVLLPVDLRAPEALFDRIDGLLLIGGADLDPRCYGQQPGPGVEATYPERDRFELALTDAALARGMPYLGICRGMQLLNVARGGTLLQELVDSDGDHPHRRIVGTFEGNEHEIELEPDSLAARAIGELVHIGRCHHHQAIDRLGEGLRVSGRSRPDGVAEAIETDDGSWALGVQWHPEASDKLALFQAFADAAREGAERLRGSAV
jgi:putative glutamine amidotransferase